MGMPELGRRESTDDDTPFVLSYLKLTYVDLPLADAQITPTRPIASAGTPAQPLGNQPWIRAWRIRDERTGH
jgi:hypothetical protein